MTSNTSGAVKNEAKVGDIPKSHRTGMKVSQYTVSEGLKSRNSGSYLKMHTTNQQEGSILKCTKHRDEPQTQKQNRFLEQHFFII